MMAVIALYGGNITFRDAPPNPLHTIPSSPNEILSFNSAIKDAMGSVVNISIKKHSSNFKSPYSEANDPLFEFFFGPGYRQQIPKERLERALGSGVILSKDGYIVTNNHVVADADEITVTLNNSDKEYSAKLIGVDPGSDLAVIKIEADGLVPVMLSTANDIKLGDVVFAIGNPFGVGETVTQGIVSALNKHSMGINQYEDFIQTDASINPGNSGGALVDSRGALIGINSAIISKSGGNNGIGFTIPVDMMRDVVGKLISDGKVQRGYLGVMISKVTEQMRPLYKHGEGAVITDVQADGTADKAGLKRGDLIYAVNGRTVDSPNALQRIISQIKPGMTATVSFERDQKDLQKEITLGSNEGSNTIDDSSLKGLSLAQIDPKSTQQYQIPSNVSGALVSAVAQGSGAEKDGFQVGDVIIQIENQTVTSPADVAKVLRESPSGAKRIYIYRGGRVLLLVAH